MTVFGRKPSEVRKFIVAAAGAIVVLVTSFGSVFADFLPAEAGSVIASAAALVTAVSVYLVRNGETIDQLDRLDP